MKSKTWFSKVLSSNCLKGMAALCMLSLGTVAYAAGPEMNVQAQQTKKVTGTVVDTTGEPVIGATVTVKGTSNGVITDFDGNFALDVPKGGTVVITSVGYATQEVKVGSETNYSITLREDNLAIDEVVVTALGIKRQSRSLGYSTTQVGGDEFTLARDNNLGNALSGKVAGVSVSGNSTGSTGSSRVIIRGAASMNGNNMPLYVIDGVPFDNSNQGSAGMWGGMDMGDGLNAINADDIESMQVLKGAAASALYGFRGGNGAIIITTKSGKKGKPTSIEFNNNITFNMIKDYRDFQTVYGAGTLGKRPMNAEEAGKAYSSNWGEKMDGGKAVNVFGDDYAYSYVDNWKNFYRTGIDETASVSISGSEGKIDYRFGITNLYELGNMPNADMNQQTLAMNTTYHLLPNLHLNVTANYEFDKSHGRSNLSDGNGNTNASLLYLANSFDWRWFTGDDGHGTIGAGVLGTNYPSASAGRELIPSGYGESNNVYFNNPYWLQYRKTNDMNRNRLTGQMNLRWDITDWLYAQAAVQRDGYSMEYKQVQPTGASADPAGWMSEYSKNFSEMNINYLIGFNKEFSDFTVGATFGGNRQRNITKNFIVSDGGRPFIVPDLWSVNNLADKRPKKDYREYRVNSLYFTADLGWKNQVFLNITGRNDWFSTLSPESNSFFYPSATLSWVFTDTFRESLPEWFDFGKIRGGWAYASNGTNPYQTALLYEIKNYAVNKQNLASVSSGSYPNSHLKPVKITEKEIGLNLSFFQSRLNFDIAYYQKNTKDDICQVSTSSTSGYGSVVLNVGEIQNNGIEFMVDATPVKTKNFMWNTTFNCAYNDSEVKYLGVDAAGQPITNLAIEGASSRSGGVTVRNYVGQPYGVLYGNKTKRDAQGRLLLAGGLPQTESEQSILGCGVYKFTGGWRNSLKYKNVSMSFLLDIKTGAKLFSGTNLSLYGNGLHKNTLEGRGSADFTHVFSGIDEATGQENTTAVEVSKFYGAFGADEFVYDASFIKLRELAIGYDFTHMLKNQNVIKGLTLNLVARNLWTIMKHTPNIDPEAAYNNSNGQGLELNGYPATRNVGFNLNVKF